MAMRETAMVMMVAYELLVPRPILVTEVLRFVDKMSMGNALFYVAMIRCLTFPVLGLLPVQMVRKIRISY